MIIRLFISLTALSLLINAAYATETDWSVHIKVSVQDTRGADGTVWNHLIAGVQRGATDGFDSANDTIAMVEADDPVQALFTHGTMPGDKNNDGIIDEWTCGTPEEGFNQNNCSLWRDMKRFDTEKAWSFAVLSPVNGVTTNLAWSFDNKPENVEIILIDRTNSENRIDMRAVAHYSYTNLFEPGKKYGLRYFEIRIKATGLFILQPDLPEATIGYLYTEQFSMIGGTPVWSLESGELPPGMSLNEITGEVTGSPTVTGSYRFTLRGDDPVTGQHSSRDYTLNINSIPRIEVDSLPDGVAGSDYRGEIAVGGGSTPMVWDILGNLPEGVTLNSEAGIVSGRLIVPGIYDFAAVVRDANGATDVKDFRITVVEPGDEKPPETVSLRGLYATDTSVLLIWASPSDDSMTKTAALYDLRYLGDCPSAGILNPITWDTAFEANGEPKPQAGTIQTYTLTGLKPGTPYCVAMRSIDAKGHVSSLSNIVKIPLAPDSSMRAFTEVTSSIVLRKGYNLISLPFMPVPNGRDSLFGSVVGDPAALYRWYSLYPGITPPQYYLEDVVQPGLGYFLYSPLDNLRLDISGLTTSDKEYRMPLQYGWNMIGIPYNQVGMLRDVLLKDNMTGNQRYFAAAAESGWIGNTVYNLTGGGYDFASFNDEPPAALEPWVGYWIYVYREAGVEIIFRRP